MKPLRFHPNVQRDINEALEYYGSISDALAEGLWVEIQNAFSEIQKAPESHHFDQSGLRRVNLNRFPYNVLFLIKEDRIRVQVLRHHSRRPSYGVRRSKG